MTGRGLFQSPNPTDQDADTVRPSPELQASGEGGGLFQSQDMYSKSTPTKSDTSLSDEQAVVSQVSDGELVLNKSSSHVDAEVRQRRLDRLHSIPSTSQLSLSPLAETPTGDVGKADEEGGGDSEV